MLLSPEHLAAIAAADVEPPPNRKPFDPNPIDLLLDVLYERNSRPVELRTKAACLGLDPDLFFTERGVPHSPAAVEACASCPVAHLCKVCTVKLRAGYTAGQSARQRRGTGGKRKKRSAVAAVA